MDWAILFNSPLVILLAILLVGSVPVTGANADVGILFIFNTISYGNMQEIHDFSTQFRAKIF